MMDGKQPTSERSSASSIGQWPRFWLRADPWPLLLIALVLMGECLWRYRSPSVAMVALAYYRDFSNAALLFGLFALARIVQRLVRRFYESKFTVADGAFRSNRRCWTWLLAMAAGTFILVESKTPMYASFLLSRTALDGIARKALADPANANLLANRWAGLYRITEVEVIGTTVVLYVKNGRDGWGFASVPGAKGDMIHSDDSESHHDEGVPKSKSFHYPEGTRYAGNWFVIYSFYYFEKVGWS